MNCSKRSSVPILNRMAPFHPREIVGDDVTVLFFDRRQVAGAAELGAEPSLNVRAGSPRKCAGLVRNAGIIRFSRDILVVVVLVAMRVDTVITKTKFFT